MTISDIYVLHNVECSRSAEGLGKDDRYNLNKPAAVHFYCTAACLFIQPACYTLGGWFR